MMEQVLAPCCKSSGSPVAHALNFYRATDVEGGEHIAPSITSCGIAGKVRRTANEQADVDTNSAITCSIHINLI